jgi:hypothetical protein
MAYSPPSTPVPAAPTVTDDSSKGYQIGSEVVVTTASPRTIYKCTDPSVGVAVWVLLGSLVAGLTTSPPSFFEDVTVYPYKISTPAAVESPSWS